MRHTVFSRLGRRLLRRQDEMKEVTMENTKDTRIAEILEEYGDIADVMEIFDIRR